MAEEASCRTSSCRKTPRASRRGSTGVTSWLIEVNNKGIILQYSFEYTDKNRAKLNEYTTAEDLHAYLQKQNLVQQFVRYADQKGVKRRNLLIQKSRKLLERNLYASIIYNMLGREEYIRFVNQSDATVQKALDVLQKGEAFPKAPETPVNAEENDADEDRIAQGDLFTEDPSQFFRLARTTSC